MVYHIVQMVIYIISVALAMIGLSCFKFQEMIYKNKVKEFYIFYIMASIALGYLFASFILSFGIINF